MSAETRVPVARLQRFVAAAFASAGCAPAEGEAVAAGLVDANLHGHDSHGVARVPRYLQWLRDGEVEAGREVAVVTDTGSLAVLDGRFGFGATVGREAVRFGMDRAAAAGGVAIVALRHAGHLGRIGQWAEMAAEAGLVSLHVVNVAGSMLVAPFGGAAKRFSTAPIAFGFPVAGEAPLILDFATSAVAEGKVLVASQGGKPLPDGCLVTAEGAPSADPATLYGPLVPGGPRDSGGGTGAIRAMGDHKGSGLALMCELLAGALAGSGCSGPNRHRFCNGMLSVYLTPAAFGSADGIAAEARGYLDWVRSARPATPGGTVLVPGEPERRAAADRSLHGIPLSRDTVAAMIAAAEGAGLAADDPAMLSGA